VSSYLGHKESVNDIKWSSLDYPILYTCSSDYFLNVFDIREAKSTKNVVYEADSAIFKLATNPINSYMLAAVCDNGDCLAIDVRKPGSFLHKLASLNESALNVDFSRKGILAVGRESGVSVYSAVDYSNPKKIETNDSISSLRWGNMELEDTLVYATYDRTLNYAILKDIF